MLFPLLFESAYCIIHLNQYIITNFLYKLANWSGSIYLTTVIVLGYRKVYLALSLRIVYFPVT